MILAIDFDGTIVDDRHAYGDLDAPLRFVHGAREALEALKRAGHVLLLYSARANRALLDDPERDPLVRAGVRRVDRKRWEKQRPVHVARFSQMVAFVAKELPGIFAAIDDGMQGKPAADLFIDDKALRLGRGALGASWAEVARMYGESPYGKLELRR